MLTSHSHRLQTTSISSPLIHGINLYNFCQKQTDECTGSVLSSFRSLSSSHVVRSCVELQVYYCAKEEGQSTMLCRFNPVEDTHTKLFPLSALGQDVQRLNNGTYIKGSGSIGQSRSVY